VIVQAGTRVAVASRVAGDGADRDGGGFGELGEGAAAEEDLRLGGLIADEVLVEVLEDDGVAGCFGGGFRGGGVVFGLGEVVC
jgi:hypothetical protein